MFTFLGQLLCWFKKEKDLQMKADMVKRLMESGHRVKVFTFSPGGYLVSLVDEIFMWSFILFNHFS